VNCIDVSYLYQQTHPKGMMQRAEVCSVSCDHSVMCCDNTRVSIGAQVLKFVSALAKGKDAKVKAKELGKPTDWKATMLHEVEQCSAVQCSAVLAQGAWAIDGARMEVETQQAKPEKPEKPEKPGKAGRRERSPAKAGRRTQ
jgi:hypothetical protein